MSAADRASWSLNNPDYVGWNFNESKMYRAQLVWDTNTLAWAKMTQPGSTAGGATEATLAKIPGISIPIHDYISLAQNTTQDIWSFKTGGSGGTLVSTITVTYVDSTKAVISTVAKT